jgi:DNA polymerase III subunit alpha
VIGGMVVGIKRSTTKRKEPMLRFTLEDTEGLVEVIVWPDLLGKHGRYLVKDALLFVHGRVDSSGDETKLVANDIIPLEEAYARLSQRLHVTVSATAGEELLPALRELLSRHAGGVRVMLHVQTEHRGEVAELLPERFAVSVTMELLTELRQLLGAERVRVAARGSQ